MSVSLEWSRAECSGEAISATSSSRRPSISFVLFFLICNSYSTSVQPSVSIPIPDRPSGGAQVRSPHCREWRVANVPGRVGRLMFNSDCRALSPSQSSSCSQSRSQSAAPWAAGGALCFRVGSLSVLYLASVEKSNLLCGTTRHDRANVHWEVNEMAILMSVYTTIWESRY